MLVNPKYEYLWKENDDRPILLPPRHWIGLNPPLFEVDRKTGSRRFVGRFQDPGIWQSRKPFKQEPVKVEIKSLKDFFKRLLSFDLMPVVC